MGKLESATGAPSPRGLRPISQVVAKQPPEILDLTGMGCPCGARFHYKNKTNGYLTKEQTVLTNQYEKKAIQSRITQPQRKSKTHVNPCQVDVRK